MAMGYRADHVFEIAVYGEQCAMKGRVCVAPEVAYGDDWRDSQDLEVWRGTEGELVTEAHEWLSRKPANMHKFKSAKSVLAYLGVE